MSAEADRILIHRLAAGELESAEEQERARALMARDPELAALLGELRELQARTRASFPEPPPARESRAFVAMMERLTPGNLGRRREAGGPTPVAEPELVPAPDLAFSMRDVAPRTYAGREVERGVSGRSVRRLRGRAPAQRDTDPGAHLFHLREIPRAGGLPVELELYAGDVLALHSEVLLVSAFAGSYLPTPGSVFGAIAERFGISFESGPPPDAIRHPDGLLHFPGASCPAFDSLWVVEMRTAGADFSRHDLRKTLDAVGRRLPAMLTGASSITLPLLGTGDQGLDPREVARELLSALPRWASTPGLRTARVVTHNLEHVATLNRALDDRDFPVRNSALAWACRELRLRLSRGTWPGPVGAALKDLWEIASVREPSLASIALEGRRVAEAVLREMGREELGQAGLFEAGGDAATERFADLVVPHLQLLLGYGRAASAGESIGANDAVTVVYGAMRAAERVAQ